MHLQAARRATEEAGCSARVVRPRPLQTRSVAEYHDPLDGRPGGSTTPAAATSDALARRCDGGDDTAEAFRAPATKDEQVLVPEAGGAACDGGRGVAVPHHPRGHRQSGHRRGRLAGEVGLSVGVDQAEEEEEFGLQLKCVFGCPGIVASAAPTSSRTSAE